MGALLWVERGCGFVGERVPAIYSYASTENDTISLDLR